MTEADAAALRARLLDLRDDTLRQLVEALPIVDTGLLRIVADTAACLRALDKTACDPERGQGSRMNVEPTAD